MELRDLKNIFSGYLNWGKEKYGILSSSQVTEAKRRFDICAKCEHNVDDRCKLCSCYIKVKVLAPNAECPDKRW